MTNVTDRLRVSCTQIFPRPVIDHPSRRRRRALLGAATKTTRNAILSRPYLLRRRGAQAQQACVEIGKAKRSREDKEEEEEDSTQVRLFSLGFIYCLLQQFVRLTIASRRSRLPFSGNKAKQKALLRSFARVVSARCRCPTFRVDVNVFGRAYTATCALVGRRFRKSKVRKRRYLKDIRGSHFPVSATSGKTLASYGFTGW